MKRLQFFFAILWVSALVPSISAATVTTLQDWCFNVGGDLSSCNNSF